MHHKMSSSKMNEKDLTLNGGGPGGLMSCISLSGLVFGALVIIGALILNSRSAEHP